MTAKPIRLRPTMRRRFLVWAVPTGVSILGSWLAFGASRPHLGQAKWRLEKRLVAPPRLPNAPVGPVDPWTVAILLATVRALVDHEVGPEAYVPFFETRAERLEGYRAVYEMFAQKTNRHARRHFGRPFLDLSLVERRAVLTALGFRPGSVRPGLRHAWRYRGRSVSEHYIVREALDRFNQTDAWHLAGYPTWPGERPRGIASYTRPVTPEEAVPVAPASSPVEPLPRRSP